jgi:hypothetical protein
VPNWTLENNVKIGGLMVADGKLLGTAYEYYDGDANARDSHFRLDSLDLAKAKVDGLFQVGGLGGGLVGGYMGEVPEEWQKALGAKYVTGQAALAVIGRTSSGPALFGFAPTALGAKPAPAVPYVYYPLKYPLGNINTKNKFYNGMTSIRGVLIPPGTGSVLFFGTHNDGDPRYKPGGWVLENGRQFLHVWAYDVREFVAVRNRQKAPWAVRPSETGELPVPTRGEHLGGVAFDPATSRLYVSQMSAARDGLDVAPLIHVFQMTVPQE